MSIEKIKTLTLAEAKYRLEENLLQRASLNISCQSDINKFGHEQFDLLELQLELSKTGNLLIEKINSSIDIGEDKVRVEFFHNQSGIKSMIMKNSEISKIPYNDFLVLDNIRYVVYSKTYNIDDDIVYVSMQTKEEFDDLYKA